MVHVVREGGKLIDKGYLDLVSQKGDGRSFGFAATNDDGTAVVARYLKGGDTPENIDEMQKHDLLKDHKLVMAFNDSILHEDDQQPFVLLKNDEDVPQIVAFLDGDFSEYHEEGSSHTDTFFCVQKELIPRIAKLAKFLSGNPKAIMTELMGDETYGRDWINFMNGPTGSITLVAATGEIWTICVAGDTLQHAFDGWWTSDKADYKVSSKSGTASPMDDLAAAMAGKSGRPKVRAADPAPAPTTPVHAPPKTRPVVPDGGDTGGDKGKPDASAAPAATNNKQPKAAAAAPDYSDPECKMTLHAPKNFDSFKSKQRWLTKRYPESMLPADRGKLEELIKGLTSITLPRKLANKAFLQDFARQEGMSGINALAMRSTASVPEVKAPETATAIPAKAGETGFPAKANEPAHEVEKTKPDVHVEPQTPQVVTEPLPVLSPEAIKQLSTILDKEDVKLAIDKAGKVIADPRNTERIEKLVEPLVKQTAGKLDAISAARWPLEVWLQVCATNPNLGAKLAFWVGHELTKAFTMMDELTKGDASTKGEVQTPVPHEQAARELRPQQHGQRQRPKARVA